MTEEKEPYVSPDTTPDEPVKKVDLGQALQFLGNEIQGFLNMAIASDKPVDFTLLVHNPDVEESAEFSFISSMGDNEKLVKSLQHAAEYVANGKTKQVELEPIEAPLDTLD